MIKKISAIVLALVLCFSIVVVPASALSDGMDVKYHVELDKDFVSPGDTVTVSLYLEVADDREWGTGAFVFGMNSAVFSMDDNAIADVKASTTMSDLAASFYKDISSYVAWQTNATVLNNISTNNTDAENALYDQYIKVTFNRAGAAGSHDNSSNTKQGLPSAEINADYEANIATFTFDLVVRDDVADGTAVNVGITSGSIAKSYSYYKYLKSPGTATTLVTPSVATSELVYTDSVIGSAAKEYETSIVSYWKDQIKMENSDYTSFSIRHLAKIEASVWESTFGTDEDKDATGTKNIKSIGFIFGEGEAFGKDENANWLEANWADLTVGAKNDTGLGTTCVPVNFVSTGMLADHYVFSCTITGVSDPDSQLSSLAYVVWEDDAGTTHYSYFESVETETFRALYDGYVAAH